MNTIETKNYQAPEIEIIKINIEKGFAQSPGNGNEEADGEDI